MIHQYKNNGYDIVMDVNSGAIHVVDDVVYDAIAMLEEKLGELEKPQQIPQEMSEEVRTELAKKYSTEKSSKFINGVLGSAARDAGVPADSCETSAGGKDER